MGLHYVYRKRRDAGAGRLFELIGENVAARSMMDLAIRTMTTYQIPSTTHH